MGEKADIRKLVQDYISEKKQFPDDSTALLTVARVGTFSDRGSLDFGGSEYTEAQVKWRTPQKRAEDDTYGWWHLSEGMYIIELNETLAPAASLDSPHLLLSIWEHAQRAGIVHSAMPLRQPAPDSEGSRSSESAGENAALRVTVSVGSTGVDIKENARLSKISVI